MLYQGRRSCGQSFRWILQAFLQADGLPFGDVLSEEDIQQAFEAEHACFARDEGDIYTPAITLWAFLSQVLHAQRLRSCAAAVLRVFRQRWHAELDLRNIKISLQLDDLRGQTPEMVRREIWVHWLAYNLIRKTIAQAALLHEKLPRQLSFAAALAAVAASWGNATLAKQDLLTALAAAQFRVIAWHQVGDRPNRVEPRAIKRHPKPHPWLRQPRHEARAQLCGSSPTR